MSCYVICFSVLHFVALGIAELEFHHSFAHNALNLCFAMLCVAVCCILLQLATQSSNPTTLSPMESSTCVLLQYVLQCVAVRCIVLQCVAVCCSVLQCVAVCCSVLHFVAHGTQSSSLTALPPIIPSLCAKKNRASMLQCNAACVAPRESVRHTYLR